MKKRNVRVELDGAEIQREREGKKSPFWKITIQIMAHNKNINFTFSRTEARSAWEIFQPN